MNFALILFILFMITGVAWVFDRLMLASVWCKEGISRPKKQKRKKYVIMSKIFKNIKL